jgi:outer membrane protein assembly factor BamA
VTITSDVSIRWNFDGPGWAAGTLSRAGLERRPPASRRERRLPAWAGTPAVRLPILATVALLAAALPVFAQSSKPSPSCPVIKKIEISPLKHTKPKLVLEELFSKVGEPFCEGDILLDKQRLDDLGFFSAATLDAVPEEDGVVLKVDLVETSNYIPNVGISHTQQNGFAAGPGLKALNLVDTGITLSAGTRFGGWTQYFVNFANPVIPGGHWTYNVALAYQDRFDELNEFQRESFVGNVRLGRTIGSTVQLRGVFNLTSTRSDVPGKTLSDTNKDLIPYVGGQLVHDTRDFHSYPHRGWHNILDGGKDMGDADYWRTRLDFRRYVSLADRHTIGLYSLTDLHTGEVGVDFPEYMLNYIGGTNTVRGWDLGVRSGQNEMLNTVEYRYEAMKRKNVKLWKIQAYIGIQLAAFWDSGIAWTESNQFAANEFINGYGVAFRLIVPWVEQVRFEIAAGQPGGGVKFGLGFGAKPDAQRLLAR